MKSFVIACAIFLAGCASMTTPRNADDSLLYAAGQITAVRDTCTQLGSTNTITKENVADCLLWTDEARKYIEIGKGTQDISMKNDALKNALEILTMLQKALKEAQ
jgi:hypothetical protein